jgi:hypothetical protein
VSMSSPRTTTLVPETRPIEPEGKEVELAIG